MMPVKKKYRPGPLGALVDEYERAAADLERVLASATDEQYQRIVDPDTADEHCRSIQSIMRHVVRAGYGYVNSIRAQHFHMADTAPEPADLGRQAAIQALRKVVEYTEETFEGRWHMTDQEVCDTMVTTRWGVTTTMEFLMEHAVVHILRHRRQIEKFLDPMDSA